MVQPKLLVKALLLDLDGTLVDVSTPCIEAAKEAALLPRFRDIDIKIGLEICKKLQSNLPLDEVFASYGIDEKRGKEFLRAFLDSWYSIAPVKTRLLRGVGSTLQRLSQNFPLALITRRDMPKAPVMRELERLGLIRYFKCILTSQDVEEPKPSPQAFIKAANHLGVPIKDCVVIGDSIVDIQAGKAAGAKTVAVHTGLFSEDELRQQNPDLVIKDLNSLHKLLALS